MKTYGLIGSSLSHSFSKNFFTDKFQSGIFQNYEYCNFELDALPGRIQQLKNMPGLSGLNITIPYKTEIIPFLDDLSDDCRKMNACNCIKIENGKWIGFNTDVIGFEKSFAPHLQSYQTKALILGTGGASKAVAFVLKKLEIEFDHVSRKGNKLIPVILYEDITHEILNNHTIVINTTPLGMYPNVNDYPNLPYEYVTNRHYFFDLIYNPIKTKFLSKAEDKGAFIKNGEQMLEIQAEESWRIWTGDI